MSIIKAGSLEFENVVLGPMAGVSDLAFRLLCRQCGAGLVYTEMVSAKAILFHNKNTHFLLKTTKEERPTALQLFGNDPSVLAEAAAEIEDKDFDMLDINMGCPVPKVVNNGEGSALMNDPALIERIVKAVKGATSRPVSVKIRKGFGKNDRNAVECALAAEQGGAELVAVHGRTREEFYCGKADRTIIRDVKEAVHVPVIANGDIYTPEDAKSMLEETGADGVMVARGAQGNPWIFARIRAYLTDGTLLPEPDMNERIEMLLKHAELEVEFKGETTGITEMRKHVAWYMSGFPGAGRIRGASNYISTLNELRELTERVKNGAF